jgi:hypothetical protein
MRGYFAALKDDNEEQDHCKIEGLRRMSSALPGRDGVRC